MTTRTIVLPELRMPFEDRTAWATVLAFIADYRPDQIIQLGHLLHLPPHGRFTGQATLELRRRELNHTADYVRHHYLIRLRKAHDDPLRIVYSAASARLATALQPAAPDPGPASPCVERLVGLDSRDGVELAAMCTVAPGWTVLYGDNLTVGGSDVPGVSALRIAQHLGVCVIVGHTMRLGKASYTVTGTDGAAHTVTGVETGTLVDHQHAKATNPHAATGWQHGLVIVETLGARVSVDCLALTGNRAAVRWAGQPHTNDMTAPQPQHVAAHAVGEPAAMGIGYRSARAV